LGQQESGRHGCGFGGFVTRLCHHDEDFGNQVANALVAVMPLQAVGHGFELQLSHVFAPVVYNGSFINSYYERADNPLVLNLNNQP
jgi:hypothetical protein